MFLGRGKLKRQPPMDSCAARIVGEVEFHIPDGHKVVIRDGEGKVQFTQIFSEKDFPNSLEKATLHLAKQMKYVWNDPEYKGEVVPVWEFVPAD